MSRITRDKIHLQREVIELKSVIERAVEASRPAIDASQHQLQVSLPETSIPISGDLIRLTQVLTNLLNNAAKYTDVGGQIWVTGSRDGDSAVIRVRDSGIGIPPALLEPVFELFTQVDRTLDRSHGGLGIGLTLVKRLVEMHDGVVRAHSEGLGHGSEFVVELPIVAAMPAAEVTRNAPIDDQLSSNSLRILVVDDNQDSAQTLSMMLKLMGHQTATAFDGLMAVEIAAGYGPHLILLDIGLPKMNGYEVCRRIRQQPGGCEIFIVALTGWGQDEDRLRSEQAGFDLHLVKPVSVPALSELLAQQKVACE